MDPSLLPVVPTPVPSSLLQADDSDSRSSSSDASAPSAASAAHDDLDGDDLDDDVVATRALSTESGEWCVICFENGVNTVLEPCGHANLCDACVSRLGKRRCPTCRARAKRVRIYGEEGEEGGVGKCGEEVLGIGGMGIGVGGRFVVKTVKQVIAERRMRESRTLEDTLQILFLGPADTGKRTLVRGLLEKYGLPPEERPPTPSLVTDADGDVFGNGSDFSANARIGGATVRLSVLRRGLLTSRRMLLDDVRVLKPDILVMCASAHVGTSLPDMLAWDKVIRANISVPRLWALLTHPEFDVGVREVGAPPIAPLDHTHNIPLTIGSISPPSLRPRAHYICATGTAGFSIGLRSLTKDVVRYGRTARDEALAAAVAQAEEMGVDEDAARLVGEGGLAGQQPSLRERSSSDASANRPGGGSLGQAPVPMDGRPLDISGSLSAAAMGNNLLGTRTANMRGFRIARDGVRDVNQSISGFVNWLGGSQN